MRARDVENLHGTNVLADSGGHSALLPPPSVAASSLVSFSCRTPAITVG